MIVLDTHAWLWWAAESSRLSLAARRQIARARRVGVPAICAWEVSMLVARGRLELDRDVLDWISQALTLPRVELMPLSPEVAVRSCRLDGRALADPADRMIVATAILHRAPLVTRDERVRRCGEVETVW